MKCFFFVCLSREAGLSREAILKERKRRIKLTESLTPEQSFGVGERIWNQIILEKRRINLRESLTPKWNFGVGGGVSKQLFLTDVEDDETAVIRTMCATLWPDAVSDKTAAIGTRWQPLIRKPQATSSSYSYLWGFFTDGCRRRAVILHQAPLPLKILSFL